MLKCGVLRTAYTFHTQFVIGRSVVQWNPSKADTTGTSCFVRYSEVSVAQGFRCSRAQMRAHVAGVLIAGYTHSYIGWGQYGKSACS